MPRCTVIIFGSNLLHFICFYYFYQWQPWMQRDTAHCLHNGFPKFPHPIFNSPEPPVHLRLRDFTSRIDYLLLSTQLVPKLQSADIGPFIWRFPIHLAKDKSFSKLLTGWWLKYTSSNESHESDASLLWYAAKAGLRGRIMAFNISHKKGPIWHMKQPVRHLGTHTQRLNLIPHPRPKTNGCQPRRL